MMQRQPTAVEIEGRTCFDFGDDKIMCMATEDNLNQQVTDAPETKFTAAQELLQIDTAVGQCTGTAVYLPGEF